MRERAWRLRSSFRVRLHRRQSYLCVVTCLVCARAWSTGGLYALTLKPE